MILLNGPIIRVFILPSSMERHINIHSLLDEFSLSPPILHFSSLFPFFCIPHSFSVFLSSLIPSLASACFSPILCSLNNSPNIPFSFSTYALSIYLPFSRISSSFISLSFTLFSSPSFILLAIHPSAVSLILHSLSFSISSSLFPTLFSSLFLHLISFI